MVLIENSKIYGMFERVRTTLEFNHKEWADVLQLTEKQYRRTYKPNGTISILSAVAFCDRFNLNLSTLSTLDIDLNAIKHHYKGNLKFIPEKYTVGAFSKKRTVLNILDHAEMLFGAYKRNELLRMCQTTEIALANSDENINIVFINDLLAALKRLGLSNNDISGIASTAMFHKRMAPLKKIFETTSRVETVFEKVIYENYSFFDKNCIYNIDSVDDDKIVVSAKPNEAAVSALGNDLFYSASSCAYRIGTLAGFPALLKTGKASGCEVDCIHTGAKSCKISIDIAFSNHLIKKEKKSRRLLNS